MMDTLAYGLRHAAQEDSLHEIRDCRHAMDVRLHTILHIFMQKFLSLGLWQMDFLELDRYFNPFT